MLNLFNKFGMACQHNQTRLERHSLPRPEFKIGLPGIGTAFAMGNREPLYQYRCPACQTDLPIGQNARWEGLYNSYKPSSAQPSRSNPPTTQTRPKPAARTKKGGPYKRETIGAKLRYDILTRDGYRCVKCGATQAQTTLHIDHKTPVSKGGTNDPSNLQTLCEKCNLGKGTRIG